MGFERLYAHFCRHLDANKIRVVPANSFEGMDTLRHLWLDANHLTEVPTVALNKASSLEAL